jgi:hypothetical protein
MGMGTDGRFFYSTSLSVHHQKRESNLTRHIEEGRGEKMNQKTIYLQYTYRTQEPRWFHTTSDSHVVRARTQLRNQQQRQKKMEPQTYKRGSLFSPPRLYLGVPNLADTNDKYPL